MKENEFLYLDTHPFCDGCLDMDPEVHHVKMLFGGLYSSSIKCKNHDKCQRIHDFIYNYLSEKGDKENG